SSRQRSDPLLHTLRRWFHHYHFIQQTPRLLPKTFCNQGVHASARRKNQIHSMPHERGRVELRLKWITLRQRLWNLPFWSHPIHIHVLKRRDRFHCRLESRRALARECRIKRAHRVSHARTHALNRLQRTAARLRLIRNQRARNRISHLPWTDASL